MRPRLAQVLSGFAALIIVSTAGDLYAQKKSRGDAEQIAKVALARFQAKDYATAARLFLEAFELSNDPGPLWNAAKAFQTASMFEDAQNAWEAFLGLSKITEKERVEATLFLEAIRAKLKPKPDPKVETATVAVSTPKPNPAIKATPEPQPSTSSNAWWLIGGGGLVAVGSGALWLFAQNQLQDLEDSLVPTNMAGRSSEISRNQAQDELNQVNGQRQLSVGLLIGAAALVGAGSVWLGLDDSVAPVVEVDSKHTSISWRVRY